MVINAALKQQYFIIVKVIIMVLRDDIVIVLDFLQHGHPNDRRPEPVAQVIGKNYFSLLEVVLRQDLTAKQGEELYIGEGRREKVDHIRGRIEANRLTAFARAELPAMVESMVSKDEQKFVDFFNKAQPLTTRMHQLELLPAIGKKHMWDIIAERKKGPFKSFDDIKARIKLLQDPKGMIIKRIIEEIENDDERYRAFVIGPPREDEW